jgi:DinB superfamily
MDREDFLHYFGQIRGRTMRLVRCIPPDKIEWTCRTGEFTLGELARHIAATERYVFAECAVGRPSRYKGCGRDLADGLENVIAFIERMHSESMEIFSSMTQADFEKKAPRPKVFPSLPGNCSARCSNTKFITADKFTFTWESWVFRSLRFTRSTHANWKRSLPS